MLYKKIKVNQQNMNKSEKTINLSALRTSSKIRKLQGFRDTL